MIDKVNFVRVGDRLFITDGKSPLRYLDLRTNFVHQFPDISYRFDGQFLYRKRNK